MTDFIPTTIWLLFGIGAFAYLPAAYVWKHVAHAPSRRDITQPPQDLHWRTDAQLVRSLLILLGLTALAVFIFTPFAAQVARSPDFVLLIAVSLGCWILGTTAIEFQTGKIVPAVRGFHEPYDRKTQPKRFWASIAWNSLMGSALLAISYFFFAARVGELCHDWKSVHPPREQLAACDVLIAKTGLSIEEAAGWRSARGVVHHQLGDYPRAMIDYDEALRLDPRDSTSHYNRGLLLEHAGQVDKAVTDYNATIKLDPANADALLRRGGIFLDTGRLSEAEADFSRAHAINPKDEWAIASRGITYAWMNDQARAEQDFAAVRLINPANIVLLRGEAILSLRRGDLDTAVKHLTAAIEVDPEDIWSLRRRADLYERLGAVEKSLDDRDALWRLHRAAGK